MSESSPTGRARPYGVPHPDESTRDVAVQLSVIAFWMRFFGIVTIVGIVVSLIGVVISLA